ncbi:MoaD/ThiS family protein [Sphingobium algorifonticola]|uniref:MoaD/ThiS family protein n=1 Tax=Sphingobium algorifonticola TaxID=2008318 RepID=A0A437J4X8_9SPHN|nr:MoaD/ThiS family protein [Sphingobium algorifonticola]RVT39850.1 MoaD/ThiS family protein [Sphingobium algorifonticola]
MAALDILYFAWVREAIGRDGERIDAVDPAVTVADLVGALAGRGGGYAEALGDIERLRAALDQHFVAFDAVIGSARELAIFPPVTGG